ncbi:MAG: Fic family protein [Planctomycetes bacterium]|nr:Fic family protein [Planctomycetota bacterium]
MTRIITPPKWHKIIADNPGRWLELFTLKSGLRDQIVSLSDSKAGYLHWTKFRHKRPFPSELTYEEAWALIKTHRLGAAKSLPFTTKKSQPISVCITDPLHAAVRRITAHRKLVVAGLPEQPNPQVKDDLSSYGLKALIDEAYYSAVIEGAVTTRKDATKLIREKRTPETKSERMILNNFLAGRKMMEWVNEPMTAQMLCEIQAVLTKDTLASEADSGQFRTEMVYVRDDAKGEVVHTPPDPDSIPERMGKLCAFANHENDEDPIPVLVRACLLHYQLAYDHPFGDGNGRTARWLFLWRLLKCPEYWWVAMLSISRMTNHAREDYYDAFRYAETDDFDATYLVRHQLIAMEREMDRFASFLTRRNALATYARVQLRLEDKLNLRQLAIFDHVCKTEDATFTQQGHAQFHGVSQPTARKDLEAMADYGLLSRTMGRPLIYKPTQRLLGAAKGFN